MSDENSDQILSPSRRALLKAAAAGGVFAVPLIASFSMDTASAQTKADAFSSSNQLIVSNMFCSNMTSVPTAVFSAQLQQVNASGVPAGPVVGLAGFEFVQGQNELFYELLVKGTLSDFIVNVRFGFGSFEVVTSSKVGAIQGSAITCLPGSPGDMALPTVYSGFAAGGSTVEVDLVNGTELLGTIVPVDPDGPFANSFRFVGQH
jgi:hypothetical protein